MGLVCGLGVICLSPKINVKATAVGKPVLPREKQDWTKMKGVIFNSHCLQKGCSWEQVTLEPLGSGLRGQPGAGSGISHGAGGTG